MAIIDDVKTSLRISNIAYNNEITDLINAAIADLKLSGITAESAVDTDPLIKRAITTYVKANFGWNNPDADRLQKSYDMIKAHITLSADYAFFAITFTITDSTTTDPIRNAEVTFDSVTKTTDASGQAGFYVREGNNYEYIVMADGYESDADDDNLVDVSASQTVAISLTEY